MGLPTAPIPGLGLTISVYGPRTDARGTIHERATDTKDRFDSLSGGTIFWHDMEDDHVELYYDGDTVTHEHLEAVEKAFDTHRVEVEVTIFEPEQVARTLSDAVLP